MLTPSPPVPPPQAMIDHATPLGIPASRASPAARLSPAESPRDPVRRMWPVSGEIVEAFNAPVPDWLPGHRGVDLAALPGEPVATPRAGRISFTGMVAGVPVVVVEHGAARATYQPVTTELAPGSSVSADEQIGTVAERGGHCAGTCLHWGLLVDTTYLDPRVLLGRPRSILVPS